MNDFDDPAFWIIVLIVRAIIMAITGVIAHHKGRHVLGWVMLAFLVEIIALIIVACLPNLKTQKDRDNRVERENRRLREQLKQEQIKSESFRQHASQRLDAHDGHLGVDTRHTLPDSGPAPAQLEAFGPDESASLESGDALAQMAGAGDASPPAAAPQPKPTSRQWHYEMNGQSHGPIDESQLMAMVRSGEVRGGTLLWTEELNDWKAADEIPALRPHLIA